MRPYAPPSGSRAAAPARRPGAAPRPGAPRRGAARGPSRRDRRARRARIRRRRLLAGLLLLAACVLAGEAVARLTSTGGPPAPVLTPLQQRIVTIAEAQLGYRTDPRDSYCNRYSAYWQAGSTAGCPAGLRSEEWCADFAAYVWHRAGVPFTYGFAAGDLSAASASFYRWGVDHGTWHPAGSRYVPKAGDVAVYGLDLSDEVAQHVAVVTAYTPGARGPDVVNGDGSRTGFSVVEAHHDQWKADIHGDGDPLAGYVSPVASRAPAS